MWRNLPSSAGGPPMPADRSFDPATPTLGQDPAVGSAGLTAVETQVDTGPTVTPDLAGMSASEARRVARLAGLHIAVEERPAPADTWGRVLGQEPAAGAVANHGDVVSLIVGGRPHVLVPELRGRDEAEAVALLHALGLTPERRATRRSDKVPEGHLLRTRPRPGTEVPVGSRVSYVLAAGPRAKSGGGRHERQRVRASRLRDGSFMTLPEE
jgi:beta-lactam-binding protein with PASTA domain